MAVHAQWSFWPSTRQENFKSNDYMTKNLIMDEARKQLENSKKDCQKLKLALKKLEAENEGKELMIAEMNEEQSKLYKERQALIDHCKVQWQEAKKKVYIPWIFRFQGYTHQQNFSDSMTKIQAVDQTLQKLQKSSQELERDCQKLRGAIDKAKAENEEKELKIAQMTEEKNQLYKDRQALIEHNKKQLQKAKEETDALKAKNEQLLTQKRYLINENDRLTKNLKQAAVEIRESRNTVREMGLWWLLRVLWPHSLAIDCWFLVFCFAYLYNKLK